MADTWVVLVNDNTKIRVLGTYGSQTKAAQVALTYTKGGKTAMPVRVEGV